MRYDLIILGNDPGGQQAAVAAVQRQKRVAIVASPRPECVPSREALRETALLLAGFRNRDGSPDRLARRRRFSIEQLVQLSREFEFQNSASIETSLHKQGADVLVGSARLLGPNEVEVISTANESRKLFGDRILLAVGTQSVRPNRIPFDGETIFDCDQVLSINRIPKSMIVVGGDSVALEYATSFALLGTRVAVVDAQQQFLEYCDREVVRSFRERVNKFGVYFRLGRAVNSIERTLDNRAAVRLEGGKRLFAECVLYASGQRGRTDTLNLAAAGLLTDEHGRLWCNEFGQTWVKHIYGIGDVVGFPAFASLSTEQGLRAVQHAFNLPVSALLPPSRGLLTIPELAMVGTTEQQLRDDLVAYEVGVARFRDASRRHIGGPANGMLKLLFHRESLEVLGVHCLGDSASKLIQLGQTVMSLGGTINSFCDESLGNSTLSACYRMAADDGLRRLAEDGVATESALRIWRPKSRRRRVSSLT